MPDNHARSPERDESRVFSIRSGGSHIPQATTRGHRAAARNVATTRAS
jgi:hypothetical protein